MTTQEASRKLWGIIGVGPTTEEINSGSLQRIADATEKMAASYDNIRNDRDYWLKRSGEQEQSEQHLVRQLNALRGVITKLKRRISA